MGGKRNVGKIGKLKTKNSLLASVDEVGCVNDILLPTSGISVIVVFNLFKKKLKNNKKKKEKII